MAVRPALVDDATDIGSVHVRSWQAAYRGVVPGAVLDRLNAERRAAQWGQLLDGGLADGEAVLVDEDEAGVFGFAAVGPSRDDDGEGTGEVRAIYLLPERWGWGRGRELMAAAVDTLAERGFPAATLWVLDANDRARRFYEHGGWSPDGATKVDDRLGVALEEVRYRRDLPARP